MQPERDENRSTHRVPMWQPPFRNNHIKKVGPSKKTLIFRGAGFSLRASFSWLSRLKAARSQEWLPHLVLRLHQSAGIIPRHDVLQPNIMGQWTK